MQSPPTPRRRGRALLLLVALAVAALLAFLSSALQQQQQHASPARALLLPPPRTKQQRRLTLRAVRDDTPPAAGTPTEDHHDAVLLPDWEVLVLLHPDASPPSSGSDSNATCAFPSGAASPARSLGRMPASGRRAYTCAMPAPERRRKPPFPAPRLTFNATSSSSSSSRSPTMLLRWSDRLVYDAVALPGGTGDVLVLARGVNPRQGVNRNASDIRCVYYHRRSNNATADDHGGGDVVVASLPATTSAQQVFRCPPPPPTTTTDLIRVTLAVAGEEDRPAIPSVAAYTAPAHPPEDNKTTNKSVVCACTMVRDVAKFLREWVVYHAAVGVDRFFLYDNGSQDDLPGEVRRLTTQEAGGFDITTYPWPWPKTQEAGFSYAAAAHRHACDWMAFLDVDEFVFSPAWAAQSTARPTKSMLRSVVAAVGPDVGQVTLGCRDFGPSGRTEHPEEGVTQGYTCRRRAEERHKSLVRLDAVGPSLVNSVHHFELRPGMRWERARQARVNHYKYQAWAEFKAKFRRRVSTYVADWTEPVNQGSKDRTPGLGFEAVEPEGWAGRFCDVEDTMLRDVTRKWFGAHGFTTPNTNLLLLDHHSKSHR